MISSKEKKLKSHASQKNKKLLKKKKEEIKRRILKLNFNRELQKTIHPTDQMLETSHAISAVTIQLHFRWAPN